MRRTLTAASVAGALWLALQFGCGGDNSPSLASTQVGPSSSASNSASASGTGGSGATGGGATVAQCDGVVPDEAAYFAQPGPVIGMGGGGSGGAGPDPKEPGASMPTYQLEDFQPLSCGYKAVYGPDLFDNRVTLVVLLAAWCGFCQSQIAHLEKMRLELQAAGYDDFQFVAVNKNDAIPEQSNLSKRCSFPVLQDTDDVQVWNLHHKGSKDDFYVYDRKGTLVSFLRMSEEVNVNLSDPEGYKTVKDVIVAVLDDK